MSHCWSSGAALAFCCFVGGCTQDMYDQPRLEPLEASSFFPDGAAARPQPAGTVARDQLYADDPYFTGRRDGEFVAAIPAVPGREPEALDRAFVERGRERFDIYCSPCHGRTGYGDGMVVQRGFPKPPSLHEERLREKAPDGQIFDVIRGGFRRMPAYGPQIPPDDRWRIVTYVRALQRSQYLPLEGAPADVQRRFEEPPP
jgi:mono/diheme cytochrome c family protein